MPAVPKRVSDRLVDGIKQFKPIVEQAKARDASEADTGTIVAQMLAALFGYEMFSEITAEFPIKDKKVDYATRVDDQIQTLIEVKAIGIKLKDAHANQAVNYAANSPVVNWVVLTNGQFWRAYFVKNEKPISQELVIEIDFLAIDHRSEDHLARLYLLCKEGWAKSAIEEYQEQRQAMSRFIVGAAILSDEGLVAIRKAIQRTVKDDNIRVSIEELKEVLQNDVIRREVLEGDGADEARRKVARAAKNPLKEASAEE